MPRSNFDVCVIGGGPAGLAAGIAFASVGRSTIILDHAVSPIDKACGEGLMPDSIAALQKLGIALPSNVGYPFRGIRFHHGASSVAADFPSGTGLGVRRTVLHSILAQRARSLGVTLLWGARVTAAAGREVWADRERFETDWVVGADGQNSAVRRNSALSRMASQEQRYGFRRHYRIAPWSQYVEIYWGEGFQVYVTPVAANEVGVAVLSRDPQMRIANAVRSFPELNCRLSAGQLASKEMGSMSVSRRLHQVCHGRLALVGDASGSVDAITGQGLGLAFAQALALAAAIDRGAFDRYNRQHSTLMKRVRKMSALLLMLDKYPSVGRRLIVGLESYPDIFASLLAVHVGERARKPFTGRKLAQFCRALVRA